MGGEMNIEVARDLLKKSKMTLIFTGAGISADSGLQTFRDTGGYWRNGGAARLASLEAFEADPSLVWGWYLDRRRTYVNSFPNSAHKSIVEWNKTHGVTLVTQNVDGLHERAGSNPLRLHGSLWQTRCTSCNAVRDDVVLFYEKLPVCTKCGGLERPNVVWFGESVSVKEMALVNIAARKCDVLLVIGTSGLVYPAAYVIDFAREQGTKIIEVNTEPCLDADVTLKARAYDIVPKLLS